jgi:hypothetical protein
MLSVTRAPCSSCCGALAVFGRGGVGLLCARLLSCSAARTTAPVCVMITVRVVAVVSARVLLRKAWFSRARA